MAFWSGETLRQVGINLFTDFDEKHVDCNSYRLSIGDQYYRTRDDDEKGNIQEPRRILSNSDAFLIPAGQFAFVLSHEQVSVPANAMAFISMSTSIKFRGLINVSGFHVDPGYNGRLVFALYNASPSDIQITRGERILKIWFASLDTMSVPPYLYGRPGITEITSDIVHGMSRPIFSLQNLSKKFIDLRNDVNNKIDAQKPMIDNLTFVWRALILGFIGTLIITCIKVVWDHSAN